MTDDQINAAVAMSMGWTTRFSAAKNETRWYDPEGMNWRAHRVYTHDLSACRAIYENVSRHAPELIPAMLHHLRNLIEDRLCNEGKPGSWMPSEWLILGFEPKEFCLAYIAAMAGKA